KSEFYHEIGGSNFDCPRSPGEEESGRPESESQAIEESAACQADPAEVTLRPLDEALADWRHSAGAWVVNQLNAQQCGIGEAEAEDLDWAAVAEEISRQQVALSDASLDDAGCDVEGNVPWGSDEPSESTSEEPGALRQWCAEAWQAVREGSEGISRQVGEW